MKKIFAIVCLMIGVTAIAPNTNGQMCEGTAKMCAAHIIPPFVSDGQTYRALITTGQNAEFHATFFAGTTYRLAGATGETDGNLIFSLYSVDPNTGDRVMIFSNSQHNNAPYWDFKVNTTVEVAIEATLNPASGKESGCAVLLIGFKQ
ncbi:MAG TPA: hypothetical protein VK826_16030 [Bacteroidia bacterium]|nr:hypothetical protein [Bacteroidia bacterium]